MTVLQRREFITLLGGAAVWPLAASAQQRAMPVIGYLSGRTADSDASILVSFRRGLADVGYAEGRNVAGEYRFADGLYDRVSAELTDLTQRKVGVIVLAAPGRIERLRQQVRASSIPIVFSIGVDPVRFGLVASINRPGGNVTGVASLVAQLSGKQLSLLHDLVPKAATRRNDAGKTSRFKTRATPQRCFGRNCLSWARAQPTRSARNLPDSTRNRRTQCS
jgi:putative ABC transport system substrate-binding protein